MSKKKMLQEGECVAAKELYISPLFRKAWTYAKTLAADRIYILSAKYGLLRPDEKITSYNETLLKKPVAECKKWANDVLHSLQMENINLQNDEFVILAGERYYKFIINGIRHYQLPYNGKRIGEILKFLNISIL